MGVTVEAMIRAGIPADEIVAGPARDEAADTWPMGLKRRPARAAPAAVVAAKSQETVSSVLRLAAAAGAIVQVQGAGTNVVGCLDGGPDVVLRLAMDRIVDFDEASQVVTAQAGVTGGRLEGYLNERGFTLGHYPQSLDHSTVGGWVATRATGTASARFGGVERTVCGLEGVLPSGEAFRIPPRPRAPGGLDALQLVSGAEGSLAVITAVCLAASRLVPEVRVNGVLPDFATGLEVQRELIQRSLPVGVARLLNPAETAAVLGAEPDPAETAAVLGAEPDPAETAAVLGAEPDPAEAAAVLGAEPDPAEAAAVLGAEPDPAGSCLLILSFLGEPPATAFGESAAVEAIAAAGGAVVSSDAADSWWDNRLAGPSLIEGLNRDIGAFFDTIELGVVWRSAAALADALQAEVGDLVDRLWMHSSHIYSHRHRPLPRLLDPQRRRRLGLRPGPRRVGAGARPVRPSRRHHRASSRDRRGSQRPLPPVARGPYPPVHQAGA